MLRYVAAGVGVMVVLVTTVVNVYYAKMTAICLYYCWVDLHADHLPWASCDNSWNTPSTTHMPNTCYFSFILHPLFDEHKCLMCNTEQSQKLKIMIMAGMYSNITINLTLCSVF